jgi:hypothetical protein
MHHRLWGYFVDEHDRWYGLQIILLKFILNSQYYAKVQVCE